MTIPSRPEAARLLRSQAPPEWLLRHACAVADTASWLAQRAAPHGRTVDRSLVDAAALLHDIDKLPAAGVPTGLHRGRGAAASLELDVCAAAGVKPGEVRRLRWSRRSLRAAAA